MEFFSGSLADAGIAIATFVGFVGMLVFVVRYLGKKSDATTAALIAVIEKQRDEYRADNARLSGQLSDAERAKTERASELLRANEEFKQSVLGHINQLFGAVQAEHADVRSRLERVEQDLQRLKNRRSRRTE